MGPTTDQFLATGDASEFLPEKWISHVPNNLPKRSLETHLDVLIVGAGVAGLMTALECWRMGHNIVGILERSSGPVYAGDIIIVGPSAINTFRHWPDMCSELESDKTESNVYYRWHNGELILGPTSLSFNDPKFVAERSGQPFTAPHQIRKKFYRTLLRQVAKVGLKVEYGQRVERYFEDESNGIGGVITQDGTIRTAHLVVAADANRTASDILISGSHVPSKSSGMSVYRSSLPTELVMQEDAFKARWGDNIQESTHEFWVGPGMHLGLMVSPEFIAWGLTPRDHVIQPGGVQPIESWSPDVAAEEVLEVLARVPNWDPAISAIIRATPKGSIVHWPLRWRNLRQEWTSKGGRVAQVGDAAHSTIPASASGATLAIEDAVTLAACLQLACSGSGSNGAPLGARIYNLLRYQRVSCSQKMSFVNAEILGGVNAEEVKSDPEKIRVRFPKWLFQHDPEAYVYEKYGQAFAHVIMDAKFKNTNLPPGHNFVPWTIEQIYEDVKNGKGVIELLDGDWS